MKRVIPIIWFLFIIPIKSVRAETLRVPSEYATIYAAIHSGLISHGDTILVAPGNYYETNLNTRGWGIIIRSEEGPNSTSIISSTPNNPIFEYNTWDSTIFNLLSGFTIKNSNNYVALRAVNGILIIQNCIFKDNSNGLTDNDIGGAIRAEDSNITIDNNIFINNRAGKGGAIAIESPMAIINSNIFFGNYAQSDGGSIYAHWSDSCLISNNLFTNDTSIISYFGGVIYVLGSYNNIINNTLDNNFGGGIGIPYVTYNNIVNNIISNNNGNGIYLAGSDSLLSHYNCIWNNDVNYGGSSVPNDGDISIDPQFIGGIPFGYHLRNISPCIDAGYPLGNPDIDGSITDIGAYRFLHGTPDQTTIISPENGSVCSPDGYLTWSRVENPFDYDTVYYALQFDDDLLFNSVNLQIDSVSGYDLLTDETISFSIATFDTLNQLQDNIQYFWRINSKNCFGDESGYTEGPNYFFYNYDNDSPNPPYSGFSPANGEEIISLIPTITWNDATDPDPDDISDSLYYDFYLFEDTSTGGQEYRDTTDQGINQIAAIDTLHDNAHFYYQVRTIDDEGLASDWSTLQNFWTNHYNYPPEPFPLYSPNPHYTQVVMYTNFAWGNTVDFDLFSSFDFAFQISPDSQFQWFVETFPNLSDTSLTFVTDTLAIAGQELYWRVLATDDDSLVRIGGIPEEVRYLRILPPGDANSSGQTNGLDVTFLVSYFKGTGPAPHPLLAGDANGDCLTNGLDVIYLVAYFKGGAAPVRPDCGQVVLTTTNKPSNIGRR